MQKIRMVTEQNFEIKTNVSCAFYFRFARFYGRILTSSILRAGLVKAFLKAKGHTKLKNFFCLSLRVFQSEIRPTNIFLTDCEILWSFQTFQIWEAQ